MTLEHTTQTTDAFERPMTLIEKLEQDMNKCKCDDWISVDERLPEREYCEYLVWVGYPDIATYSKFGWELPSDAVITHWQPIQPPSEV